MRNVLALILGGGRGTRLHPLTELRSKPAVPIGGKYRLIDVPISNCLHAELRRIFVLTQFNSASLNHHVSNAYRMDLFSRGFVEILAAEQTPDSTAWFQGTADAVRKAQRHFIQHEAEYYLILAGDHLYRMNYAELLEAHLERQADITIAALPVDAEDATGMGIFSFDAQGRISGFEEKPDAGRLRVLGPTLTSAPGFMAPDPARPYIASMGIYLFSREVLLDLLEEESGDDFGRELIPTALTRYRVRAFAHRGYWADVGTIESFYDANIMLTRPDAPFSFYDPAFPTYTHARFLPPSKLTGCQLHNVLVAEGGYLEDASVSDSVVGIRASVGARSEIRRSVLLGADYYEPPPAAMAGARAVPIGIGRDVVLDRVIVDKNARIGDGARLVNAAGIDEADGDGYYIRNGIIIVPKDGTIAPGMVV
ncbi:MAG TPA: glucose-1-phosphate adenylyltransferase [Vicinamibacterales bacterium]|nr:glucose-1-phosphate adenylyltransferase [Vicinamibacterales bacterium]